MSEPTITGKVIREVLFIVYSHLSRYALHLSISTFSIPSAFPKSDHSSYILYQKLLFSTISITMPSNKAAWLVSPKAKPLVIKEAPYTPAGQGEILIRNAAMAINPIDPALQDRAHMPITYPAILGQDVAGEVVDVGPGAIGFHRGDRVVGHAIGFSGMLSKRSCDNGFQEYTILRDYLAVKIPSTVSYEQAVVLPLGLSTASCGLFQKGTLGLRLPSSDLKPTGETVLIWGGSGSVGNNAIQLAVATGYNVITTASPKNFGLVKKLGASEAFDYNSPNITEDLVNALKDKNLAGAMDCNGRGGGFAATVAVMEALPKDKTKLMSTVISQSKEELPGGTVTRGAFGGSLKDDEVGPAIWRDFLGPALAQGRYILSPEPNVVGKGLESLQDAFEVEKTAKSGKKTVVIM